MTGGTTLWMALGLLAVIAATALLLPSIRRARTDIERSAYDLTVYRDQLAEIERDMERGLLTHDQVAAARTEIERRMLATETNLPTEPAPGAATGGTHAMIVVWALTVPIGAALLYLAMGSPDLPDQPFAERARDSSTAMTNAGELTQLAEQLAARLVEDPSDPRGWALLGRSYRTLGRFVESAKALAMAVEKSGGPDLTPPDLLTDYGEALVAAADGSVTPAATQAFKSALARSREQPRARHYLAVERYQAGDLRTALAMWRALEADSPPDAPWLDLLRERIAKTAAALGVAPESVPMVRPDMPPPASAAKRPVGPNQADIEAAARMTPAERQAFIRSMVARLAARMAENPDEPDGWIRLGRAYLVLDETDKAAAALGRAAALWRTELAKLTPGTPEHIELERRIKTLEAAGLEPATKP